MAKVLNSSAKIRREIIDIFKSAKRRRVAITAFVGKGADAYLPNAKGLKLICWPKAGGTNPHEIRNLIGKKVNVEFCDGLHMKVYWSEGKGAIVTSANLSKNALGSGDLKEFGVKLSSDELDINGIIKSLKRRKVTEKELRSLDRLHDEYQKRNPARITKHVQNTFPQWHDSYGRGEWKLGWYATTDEHIGKTSKARVRQEYDMITPCDVISCKQGEYKDLDWVLSFRLSDQGASSFKWMNIDFITRVTKNDPAHNEGYPYEAVQIHSSAHYGAPPFKIDSKLRNAFQYAVMKYGGRDKIKLIKSGIPPKKLLNLLYDQYRSS